MIQGQVIRLASYHGKTSTDTRFDFDAVRELKVFGSEIGGN
jgi:hypothetical protein